MRVTISFFLAFLAVGVLLSSCRRDEVFVYSQQELVDTPPEEDPEIVGLYVLNSGVKGNNEATLDYFDCLTSTYHRNIYAERNPDALPSLGDNGTDLAVADGKLYVILSGSHRLEIFNVENTQRFATVSINNPRRILLRDNYAYITSYLKQKEQKYGELPLGELVRIKTDDLTDIRKITLGCQPDEMLYFVAGNESTGSEKETLLLVSNTGEYNSPHFDNRLSVVNLDNFVQTSYIRTGTSPHCLAISGRYLYVETSGNYKEEPPQLCILRDRSNLNTFTRDTVRDLPSLSFVQVDDTLFMIKGRKNQFGDILERDFVKYSMKADDIVDRFVADGTETQIETPTSVAVHPVTHEIFITDARRGTSSGLLHCYTPDGRQKWKVKTGIAPCKVAFVKK